MGKKGRKIAHRRNASRSATFDDLMTLVSDRNSQVRKSAVFALGMTGNRKAVGPLNLALAQELARDPGSDTIILDIIDALSRIPDSCTLDAFIVLESRMVDRDSPRCPAGLPAGIASYTDPADGLVRRAVPRAFHYKVLDVMRTMCHALNDRTGEVTARYNEYQQEVVQAEIDRIMPDMTLLLQRNDAGCPRTVGNPDASQAADDALPAAGQEDVDFDAIRQVAETEIAMFFEENDKLWTLVRQGQSIKARINRERAEKAMQVAMSEDIEKAKALCE